MIWSWMSTMSSTKYLGQNLFFTTILWIERSSMPLYVIQYRKIGAVCQEYSQTVRSNIYKFWSVRKFLSIRRSFLKDKSTGFILFSKKYFLDVVFFGRESTSDAPTASSRHCWSWLEGSFSAGITELELCRYCN